MHHTFVVMVCGPHLYDDRDSPCENRIDAATQAALYYKARLLVCGDARDGLDLTRFVARARRLLPEHAVISCYDQAGNTLGDVQAALRAIKGIVGDGETAAVELITDDYHMRRLGTFFRGEMAKIFARGQLRVRDFGMPAPPRAPTDDELAREEQGICDYLAGRYNGNGTGLSKPPPAAPDVVGHLDLLTAAPSGDHDLTATVSP